MNSTVISRKKYVLTKFHEDWAKHVFSRLFTCLHYIHTEKTAPPPSSHVFSVITTIFKLNQEIHKTNVLTKFHDDWTKLNTAPLPGCHVFQRTGTIFELHQHIIKTNILTNFKLYPTRNVASRVFTRQNVDHGRMTDGRRTKGDPKSSQ
ncbi:hypothetical protein DPMN_090701 [Dreissena polymorpha]|uniref:Uncharacterized protein n=1 Tax=Dreissena polymorpha TaxID=45954 RepID=A0A9D4QYG3_DREPO|nr:hypothetical protein DPMN_090701 [Dreissena polymorpha]